jgi:hypothetical protein
MPFVDRIGRKPFLSTYGAFSIISAKVLIVFFFRMTVFGLSGEVICLCVIAALTKHYSAPDADEGNNFVATGFISFHREPANKPVFISSWEEGICSHVHGLHGFPLLYRAAGVPYELRDLPSSRQNKGNCHRIRDAGK